MSPICRRLGNFRTLHTAPRVAGASLIAALVALGQASAQTFHGTPYGTPSAPQAVEGASSIAAHGGTSPNPPGGSPRRPSTPLVARLPDQPGLGAPSPLPAQAAGPPFVTNELEQQFVKQVLENWEDASDKIKTFNSEFERWEYYPAWFSNDKPMIKSHGRLSYAKPDRGSFKIEEIRRWKNSDPKVVNNPDLAGDYALQKDEVGEHWVCDGKAIYQYDHLHKQLNVTALPPEMRGQAIVNGPLPFLFGAKANELLQRYWMRSTQSDATRIWLVAYPRWQSDAANYHHVEVILDRKTMQPQALLVHQPGGNERHMYAFKTPTVNGKMDNLFGSLFSSPRTPLGWKKVLVEAPEANSQAAEAPPLQR